jgi:hypothetical protein
MNTLKANRTNDFVRSPELSAYVKKHELETFREELGKYVTKDLLEKDIHLVRKEVLERTRDIGALVEHQEDKFKTMVELWMISNERIDRRDEEYREYTRKQDATNNATWFRVSKLEDKIFGINEEDEESDLNYKV